MNGEDRARTIPPRKTMRWLRASNGGDTRYVTAIGFDAPATGAQKADIRARYGSKKQRIRPGGRTAISTTFGCRCEALALPLSRPSPSAARSAAIFRPALLSRHERL